MQLFVFGFSATVVQRIAQVIGSQVAADGAPLPLFDASRWVSDEFSLTSEGSGVNKLLPKEYRSSKQRFLRQRLTLDPYYGLGRFDDWREAMDYPAHSVIANALTPDEFISMLQSDPHNAVIQMKDQKSYSAYPDALDEARLWIEQYLSWRGRLGNPIPVLVCDELRLEAELTQAKF